MKCHYVYDKVHGKILIPGCWGSLHQEDKSCCTCNDTPSSFAAFEKKEYREKLKLLQAELKDQSEHIEYLEKIIDKFF